MKRKQIFQPALSLFKSRLKSNVKGHVTHTHERSHVGDRKDLKHTKVSPGPKLVKDAEQGMKGRGCGLFWLKVPADEKEDVG